MNHPRANNTIVCLCLWLLLGLYSHICAAREPLRITMPAQEQSTQGSVSYYGQLLRLALSKTEVSDGPFELIEYPHLLPTSRFLSEVKRKGVVDIAWSATSPVREQELLPIRVPLLKDLNSYRVFLIRKEDQPRFSHISNLAQLRAYRAGQGAHWPDTDILLANSLPVVTSAQYEPLFNMLQGKRIDYFPRGLDEVWNEEQQHANKGLAIEQHLMLRYYSPQFFFVHKDNKTLADRVERGLKKAIADGSFDTLFNSIPTYKRGYEELQANKRKLFVLKTPKQP